MIKTYTPNALIAETQEVIKQHPVDGSVHAELSDLELRELLNRICKCAKEKLPVIALTLSKRQNLALAGYFPHNKYNKPEENIAAVLSLNMTPRIFQILFDGWQSFPRNYHLFRTLVENDTKAKRPQKLSVPIGRMNDWMKLWLSEQDYFKAIQCYAVGDSGSNLLFSERYKKSGLNPKSSLYINCYSAYLCDCSMKEYRAEGDALVSFGIRQAVNQTTGKAIMLNLLSKGEKSHDDLIAFARCYREIFNQYRTPRRESFPTMETYRTYVWWYNYHMIVEGFNKDADRKRVEFWSQYLEKCTVSRLKKQQFLFMDFGKYVAVESEVMGTLYFYTKPYFEGTVKTYLALHTSQEGKSWMKNYSASVYDKAHRGYWQGEVPSVMRRLGMI